jgi:glycosyltransferase involved in cell wall biosynthesis
MQARDNEEKEEMEQKRLRLVSFVEGAFPGRGGIGIPAAYHISHSLAHRGHSVLLSISGPVMPELSPFAEHMSEDGVQAMDGSGCLQTITYPASSLWAFAPTLLWKAGHQVESADFVLLNSLYSFPVLVGYAMARHERKPYAIWLHGALAPVQRSYGKRKKTIYDQIIARHILNKASFLVYTARGEREETRSLNLTAPSVVIPLGVDSKSFSKLPPRGEFRSKYLNGHAGPLVLFLGRLTAKKGLDLTSDAIAQVLKQIPDVRFAIVGTGDPPEFTTQVKTWLQYFGIVDKTVMTGMLTGYEKLQALADADVFVLLSEAENFGQAMFEAMASRVPVIISDTLNLAGEVERYAAGIVVPRDPGSAAKAIACLLLDLDRRHHMGENAQHMAQAYSWEKTGEQIERAIVCLLGGNKIPADLTQFE